MAFRFAALAAPVQIVIGDWAAATVAENQPTKLAAIEGLATTTSGAPSTILGWYTRRRSMRRHRDPEAAVAAREHDPDATVEGLDAVPPDHRPPVNIVRFAFQTMVAIGTLLSLLGAVFVFTCGGDKRLPRSPWFYRAPSRPGRWRSSR